MGKLAEQFAKRIEKAISGEWGALADFEKRSGISSETVRRWIKRVRVPDLDQVEAAARALGKEPIDLLFPGELPKPERIPPTPSEALQVLFAASIASKTDFVAKKKYDDDLREMNAENTALQKRLAKSIEGPFSDELLELIETARSLELPALRALLADLRRRGIARKN